MAEVLGIGGIWQRFRQHGCWRKAYMDVLAASFDKYPRFPRPGDTNNLVSMTISCYSLNAKTYATINTNKYCGV